MNETIKTVPEVTSEELERIFKLQKENQFAVGNTTVSQRKAKLKLLHKAILKYRPEIKDVMFKDYKKHPSEVDLTEVFPITSEIKHAKRNLSRWMGKRKVTTPIALLGSSSYIKYEPKGVVLIISPWNFPFNLTFGPLVGAIAAGNTVIIKPSEHTPNSSALMKKIISEVFNENEVALIEGSIEASKTLLAQPFNHIFFTGAPNIGKVVMAAAAKHLTSVTLELGGKSPTIVDETANIDMAARRIAWGKYLNNGQVCIAPDYVFVHESKKELFLKTVEKYIKKFYTEDISNETSYSRIVNERHFNRIKGYVEDAIQKGAKVNIGGEFDDAQNYISPTVISEVPSDADLMTNEIFGPIMPVYAFSNLNEVINKINEKEKPLSLYIYSKSSKNIKYILNNTRAGGGCINHSAVHFFNTNLPFGGSNNSGIGKGHGWHGFQSFSNPRGILKQHIPNALELLLPPYNDFKQNLINLTIKYF
ncbi:aldehyde dehydrogenase (NAD+) [Maribacter vaceletii]|uniref:Aldehyde dehydrogenase n=1 Tax=Maribacter vaceletii TaxID=1206816 RepID=A0A495DU12_9FLAO|nr:aldehyde dehydrogenase family protein [Maribacter vaceletii]RKR07973.1 aldehyde dehydrogenase (NAD+) [Maribacter vaceletii]